MIPRTKVNYRQRDLVRAFLIGDDDDQWRKALTRRLGELFGTSNILLTASGRGALYILLSCLPQRRVLVPAYTCKAVVEAAHLAGKEVLFGESDAQGFNMAVDLLDRQLDADTILVATHQFGIPCQIRAMIELANAKGAFVIEDAAASMGSRVDGQLTGTFGDAAFFSFDSTKLVNVPLKGGFLRARDSGLFARCQTFMASATAPMPLWRKLNYLLLGAALVTIEHPLLYRLFHNLKFNWRGRFTDDSADFAPRLGPFYLDRLAEWQAALLLPQVERLDSIVETRRRMYALYSQRLQGARSFVLPPEDSLSEWAPIRYPIRVDGDKLVFYRQAVRRGVDFAFSFTFIASPPELARAHRVAASVLDLPFYNRLSTNEIERVVTVLRELDSANK
jgi:dTDP-4-amino-4,6-dideoxygalactose transaminase